MEFGCSSCEYTSSKKQHISNHIKRKNSCGPGTKEIIEIPIEIKCQFCNKDFSTKQNLKDHIKNNCKINKEEVEKLKEEVEKLKQELKDIKNKKICSTNIKIRAQARKIYKENFKLKCIKCKNLDHIEICHIKPVKEFDIFSEIDTINKLDNLIGLCPNCHKDLDHSKKFEVARVATLHSFIIRHLENISI
jgi:predicted HNH restriction endonuclease